MSDEELREKIASVLAEESAGLEAKKFSERVGARRVVADRILALVRERGPVVCIGSDTLRRLSANENVVVNGVGLVAASDFPRGPVMPEEPSEAVDDAMEDLIGDYARLSTRRQLYIEIRAALQGEGEKA